MQLRETHNHVALVGPLHLIVLLCLPQSHNFLNLSICSPCLPPSSTAEHLELRTRFFVRGVGKNWRLVGPESVGSFTVNFTVGRESHCVCLLSGWELAHASQHLRYNC